MKSRFIENLKILPRRPRFIARVVRNYLFLMTGKPVLRNGELALTYSCNCSCSHCSAAQLAYKNRIELETNEIKKIIDEFLNLGAIQIMFTGGEPTLRSDLKEIIRYIDPDKAIPCLLTNGRDVSSEILEEYHRAGLRHLGISLDSAAPSKHDQNRNAPGLFREVLTLIAHAQSIGLYVQILSIATRDNVRDGGLRKLVELARKLGVDINIIFASSVGAWRERQSLLLTDEDHRRVMGDLISLKHVRWEGDSGYLKSACPAGAEKMYVTAYGDVLPCDFIQISFGNVREEPLRDIWERMRRVKPFRERQKVCISSVDRDFIDKYLAPLNRYPGRPVPWNSLPACRIQANW